MSEVEIRLARAADVARLPEIERRASTIFSPEDLPPAIARGTASLETYSLAQHERRLIVAWNAPFYAGLGWRVLPQAALSEALHGLRENEQRAGLDLGRRVIMRRPIRAADRALGPGPI